MKTLLSVLAIVVLLASNVLAGDAFKRWDKDRAASDKSITRDFDNDGIPNVVDSYDNDQFKSDFQKDYDHDGTPNPVDPYDNDWYKP